MATAVIMPRQGQSVESCIIGRWHKQVGDTVAVGDELFSYETDKAAFDETAQIDGELLAVFFAEGDDVPCLTTVAVIGQPGEDLTCFAPADAPGPAISTPPAAADSPSSPTSASAGSSPTVPSDAAAQLAISPRARNLAEKHHADLRAAVASGPKGRIVERDVQALIAAGKRTGGIADDAPAAADAPDGLPEFTEEKHSHIRTLIAKSMNHSLSTMAQLTYTASFDAGEILDFRAKLKKATENGLAERFGIALAEAGVTLNDIVLYAVSRVVLRHPACNAAYLDDRMVYYKHVNLGLAVDTPRGLMVPTIFRADLLSLAQISAQAKTLAAECQRGTISPDKLKHGTFTVSNLGGLGVESFTPVINPPQTAILGVNCLETRVRDVGGVAVPYPAMSFSLTCDHRAVDGAPAARLLQDLKSALENFSLLLMK